MMIQVSLREPAAALIIQKGGGLEEEKEKKNQTYGVTGNLHNHEGARVAGSAPKGKKKAD